MEDEEGRIQLLNSLRVNWIYLFGQRDWSHSRRDQCRESLEIGWRLLRDTQWIVVCDLHASQVQRFYTPAVAASNFWWQLQFEADADDADAADADATLQVLPESIDQMEAKQRVIDRRVDVECWKIQADSDKLIMQRVVDAPTQKQHPKQKRRKKQKR